MDLLTNFKERFTERFSESSLSPTEFAARIGITPTSVYRYLEGKHIPPFAEFVKMADAFQCSGDYLLGLTDEYVAIAFKEPPALPRTDLFSAATLRRKRILPAQERGNFAFPAAFLENGCNLPERSQPCKARRTVRLLRRFHYRAGMLTSRLCPNFSIQILRAAEHSAARRFLYRFSVTLFRAGTRLPAWARGKRRASLPSSPSRAWYTPF